jgi:hypothetical protein
LQQSDDLLALILSDTVRQPADSISFARRVAIELVATIPSVKRRLPFPTTPRQPHRIPLDAGRGRKAIRMTIPARRAYVSSRPGSSSHFGEGSVGRPHRELFPRADWWADRPLETPQARIPSVAAAPICGI